MTNRSRRKLKPGNPRADRRDQPDITDLIDDLKTQLDEGRGGADLERRVSEITTEIVSRLQLSRLAEGYVTGDSVTVTTIAAQNLKFLRQACNQTQDQLAGHMRRLGFSGWARITVAECESGKRRLSWEELLALSILFGQPVVDIVGNVPPRTTIELNESIHLTAEQFDQLLGRESRWNDWATSMGKAEQVAAEVIGVEAHSDADWRPQAQRERSRRPR